MPSLFWTFVVIIGLSVFFGWPMEVKKSYYLLPIVADFVFAEIAALVIVVFLDYIIDYPYSS